MPTVKRAKKRRTKTIVKRKGNLPEELQKVGARMSGQFYKFFSIRLVPSAWSCGIDACPHVDHITAKVPKLFSPVTNNSMLQKAGDFGVATGRPIICGNGWHAVPAAYLGRWGSFLDSWASGNKALWCVTLYGSHVMDSEKVAARGIEMDHEVVFDSPEGKKLRNAAHKKGWRR